MNKKKCFIWAGIMYVLFALLTVLLITVDVTAGGVNGSDIGLSGINLPIKEALGTSEIAAAVSEYAAYVGFVVVGLLALWFLIRIVKEKSLGALTKKEYTLGGLYFVTCVLYFVFGKIVINYRPIIKWDEEGPESSFPSTHAMLAVVIFGSFFCIAGDYIKNESFCRLVKILSVVFAVTIIIGRMLSGVHWFTDIVGGIIIAVGLLFTFEGIGEEDYDN